MATLEREGVAFPAQQAFWNSARCQSLGIGLRSKKIGFSTAKIHVFTIYAEPEAIAAAVKAANATTDDQVAEAIIDAPCTKAFYIQLMRKVASETFGKSLGDTLKSSLPNDGDALQQFADTFKGQGDFDVGSNIIMLWKPDGVLDVAFRPPGQGSSQADGTTPVGSIANANLCRALFNTNLGTNSGNPEARAIFIKTARELAA